MKEIEREIGIYTDIYPTGEKDKYGQRICHARCKICNTEVYKAIDRIRRHHSICNHVDTFVVPDIGIYTDIHESGNRSKDGHKLYYATCSICNTVVEKMLSNIKESNKICRHKVLDKSAENYKLNDMPTGWMNQSELNMRIYDTWKAMIFRTTQKFWDKYPTYEGTTVDDSWRILSNFVNDIRELNGYDQWAKASGERMMLDKDTLIYGNKHYSKDTCCFISHADSNRDVHQRHPENLEKARKTYKEQSSIPVKLTNKVTKEVKYFPSIKEACRQMNLNLRQVWMILSDKYPGHYSTKGWLVEAIEQGTYKSMAS